MEGQITIDAGVDGEMVRGQVVRMNALAFATDGGQKLHTAKIRLVSSRR